MANLFTTQTPSGTDNSDGAPGITTATSVVFAVNGTVTGIRFYAAVTVSGTYTGALWQVVNSDPDTGGGTLLASKTLGTAPTGGTWNTITFDTPVSVTAGTTYRAGLFSGDGRYVNTAHFFDSSLTNGNITGPANGSSLLGGSLNQGVFIVNASLAYPTNQFNANSYGVDVEFTAGGAAASTASPYVLTPTPVARPGQQVLLRNTAALIVAPAKGTAALVTTRPVPVPPAAALLRRSALLDPPVLTTARPIVVTAVVAAAASSSILLRAPQVGAAPAVATTPGPIVVTALVLSPIAPTILVRAPQALAASPQPTVVTAPVAPPAAEVLLVRGSLSDTPVLTTASPTVVTNTTPPTAPAALQLRNPQPSVAIVSGPTTAPIVITQPGPPPASAATTLRSSLVDVPVATPGPMVVTSPAPVRPSPPIVARGSLADYYAGTEPLIITTVAAATAGVVLLGRNPQPFIPPVPGPTTAPIVVAAPRRAGRASAIFLRAIGVPGVIVPSAPGPRIRTTTRVSPISTSAQQQLIHTDTRGD